MKRLTTLRLLLALAVATVAASAGAQLVDRATFERLEQQARGLNGSAQHAPSNVQPQVIGTMPFVINDFAIRRGESVILAVTFNTAVMSAYRSEQCPRVGQFDLQLPDGLTVINVTRGSSLQYTYDGDVHTPINVNGYYDADNNMLRVLGYGVCGADEMALLPTGELEYALITVRAEQTMELGVSQIIESGAMFALIDLPRDFYYAGTATINATVNRQPAESVTLNATSVELNSGDTYDLVATVLPADALQSVLWTSDNPDIATVLDGHITGVSVGETYVTAATMDGSNKSARCLVRVTDVAYTLGDLNSDGFVNGSDINVLINVVLGKDHNDYQGRADLNGDGLIDGIDLNVLIDIVLGK